MFQLQYPFSLRMKYFLLAFAVNLLFFHVNGQCLTDALKKYHLNVFIYIHLYMCKKL